VLRKNLEGNKTAGAAYLLYFNNTPLNATSLTPSSFFSGYDTLSVGEGINNTRGWIDYGEYITGGGEVTDSGTFTTVTFQAIIHLSPSSNSTGSSGLNTPFSYTTSIVFCISPTPPLPPY